MKSRPITRVTFALLAVLVCVQFVRPTRINPPTDQRRTVFARMDVPPRTAAVLERACRDCHSNDTRWPWYSNVAPLSWFVIDHVNHGAATSTTRSGRSTRVLTPQS